MRAAGTQQFGMLENIQPPTFNHQPLSDFLRAPSLRAQLDTRTKHGLNFRNSKKLITPSPPSEAGGEGRGEEVFSSKSPLPALRCGARELNRVRVPSYAASLSVEYLMLDVECSKSFPGAQP
jgi:hypothetical protein